jgi:hypothetical protein
MPASREFAINPDDETTVRRELRPGSEIEGSLRP